jgi:hypothetical protein
LIIVSSYTRRVCEQSPQCTAAFNEPINWACFAFVSVMAGIPFGNLNSSPAWMRTTNQLQYFQKLWPIQIGVILMNQSIPLSTNGASILALCLIGSKGCVTCYLLFVNRLPFSQNRIQATPEGAKQGERFGIGMIGWSSIIEAGAVVKGQLHCYIDYIPIRRYLFLVIL